MMHRVNKAVPAMGDGAFSLLSDKGILRAMEAGKVVISDFKLENLNTCSYDVTLAPCFFREAHPEPGQSIYNPYSEKIVSRVWGQKMSTRLEIAMIGEASSNTYLPPSLE
eukprot:TRINITY_DN973_c0_g1_i4.p1 TRINITY_DN973_c0_g1~~TRINITY_DN973_c0_g1_i4.p1  ORF type:complete len:110 (-),score=21.04 TRINITY_DN973_c0_g1_i4:284-613(-)